MTAIEISSESDIRLEDYLDDKLQSSTDLETENLGLLLKTVESQRSVLQAQLEAAVQALEKARRSGQDRHARLQARIAEFESLQKSIDLRQAIVAQSDAPDVAICKLRRPLEQLHRVEFARRYLGILKDVETWRTEALRYLPSSPKGALEPYSRIKKLVSHLHELQGPADGAAVHLVSFVDGVANYLWDEMQKIMITEMECLLKSRGWPHEVDEKSEMDPELLNCFEKLLDLQLPEIIYGIDNSGSQEGHNRVLTLLPLAVMTKPFVQEFRFHFLSDRPTSKPEALPACFRWFLALVSKWEEFFRVNLVSLFAIKFRSTRVELHLVYVDPVSAFVTAMLPIMREKVLSIAHIAAGHPQLLSSLIADLTAFDNKIRFRFHYDGGDAQCGWAGLTSEVLANYFSVWFEAEKTFALERLQDIIHDAEARGLDYEFGGPGKTKPTYAAVRIMDLLENITTDYKGIRSFEYKLRFLVEIQNAVLEEYNETLRGSLELYQSLTSAVGRTLHGPSREQMAALEGTGAFESLCKVLGSSEYVVKTLGRWGMDEFFIGLWIDLNEHTSRLDTHTNPAFCEGLSYVQVKSVTSARLGSDLANSEATIFDAPIAAFSSNRGRAEELLIGALIESDRDAFKNYCSKSQWTSLGDDVAADLQTLPLSPDLVPAIETLQRNLEYTSKTLSTPTYRRVWRNAISKLEEMLYTQVLLYHSFTTLGAKQLVRDLAAISTLIFRFLHVDRFFKMKEAAMILSLPLQGFSSVLIAPDVIDGDALDQEILDENPPPPTLGSVYERVFANNDEARKVLAELKIETLTPSDARKILQRRVEASE